LDDTPRERVRERFGRRCGYCGVHEDDAGATLTLDHHQPRVRGDDEQGDNLVYACARCNEHKGSYWHADDPPHVRLLHPGRESLTVHFSEDPEGRLAGTTAEGSFFVERLQLNRPQLVAYRRGARLREKLAAALVSAQERVRALEKRMSELDAAIDSVADEIDRE
jgi:hypothetical protein